MNMLIVGASRGIGFELLRQHRLAGDAVTATARDADALARLRGHGAIALALDVADAASAAGLSAALAGARFDQVIVNAGVFGPRSEGLQVPGAGDFDRVMHTNVLGAMRVLAQLGPHLAPGAKVAVISSEMGSIGGRSANFGWLYRASKAALNSVLADTAIAYAGHAICVALHPGWVRTDMGGPEARLDVADSVAGIRRVMAGLTGADHGRFFNIDGTPLPW